MVSPFDGALSESPPQRVTSRRILLEIFGLPLHLRLKGVVSKMLAGFASICDGSEVLIGEGDIRSLKVEVEVTNAGSIPDSITVRCGGTSWLVRLAALGQVSGQAECGQDKSSENKMKSGTNSEERNQSDRCGRTPPADAPETKKRKDCHCAMAEEHQMGDDVSVADSSQAMIVKEDCCLEAAETPMADSEMNYSMVVGRTGKDLLIKEPVQMQLAIPADL
jgi:hypothetical protein